MMYLLSMVDDTVGDLSGAPVEAMARAHVMKVSTSINFGEY